MTNIDIAEKNQTRFVKTPLLPGKKTCNFIAHETKYTHKNPWIMDKQEWNYDIPNSTCIYTDTPTLLKLKKKRTMTSVWHAVLE